MNLEKIYNDLYFFTDFENFEKRFKELIKYFHKYFGNNDEKIYYFSVPGRVELIGNHTDHNHGKVIATSINLDAVAIARKIPDNIIKIYSVEFDRVFEVDIDELNIKEEEKNSTNALIRGIVAGFRRNNKIIGGFEAVVSSQVMVGSGLSSSAAFEVLIGKILSVFYNNDELLDIFLAQMGQFAENQYFGKPCGLMDQIAVAYGGIVFIDFANIDDPIVESIDFDFNEYDYKILVVNTGGSHADLTDDYASIPQDMRSIAKNFGIPSLKDLNKNDIYEHFQELCNKFGDRAVLRALHFFDENKRVELARKSFFDGNIDTIFQNIILSGDSSIKWLQNGFSIKNIKNQKVMLGLYLSEEFFRNNNVNGGYRVHGGGFAGTILVILKNDFVDKYVDFIGKFFDKNSVNILQERRIGAYFSKL